MLIIKLRNKVHRLGSSQPKIKKFKPWNTPQNTITEVTELDHPISHMKSRPKKIYFCSPRTRNSQYRQSNSKMENHEVKTRKGEAMKFKKRNKEPE